MYNFLSDAVMVRHEDASLTHNKCKPSKICTQIQIAARTPHAKRRRAEKPSPNC